jgi:hypothetical protein
MEVRLAVRLDGVPEWLAQPPSTLASGPIGGRPEAVFKSNMTASRAIYLRERWVIRRNRSD